jgi:hypothetical protein
MDNEPRTFGVRQAWLDANAEHIKQNQIGHDDLLFATTAGTPISRNTFRTRIWLPAVKAGTREFQIDPQPDGTVSFTHVEDVTGLLFPVFRALIGPAIQQHQNDLNDALKRRAEAQAPS